MLEAPAYGSPHGIVEAGAAVIVPGEATNNGGLRKSIVARDATTGAEIARYEFGSEMVSHVLTDDRGPVLWLSNGVSLRYAAGSFTDASAEFAALSRSLSGHLFYGTPAMSTGVVDADGGTFIVEGDAMVCRFDVHSLTVSWCTLHDPLTAWQLSPSALVGATTRTVQVFRRDNGRALTGGRPFQSVFLYERWAFDYSGRWNGGP